MIYYIFFLGEELIRIGFFSFSGEDILELNIFLILGEKLKLDLKKFLVGS
jgi:hypothetical protein